MSAIAKIAKNRKKYECKLCDYNTCNKCDFEKHIQTQKHIYNELSIKSTDLSINLSEKSEKSQTKIFTCETCNKEYKDNSGLWRHNKKCNIKKENATMLDKDEPSDKDLIMLLLKQNSELLEVIKNGTHNTTNNHNNSHNKSFNLQFFLNETCKDAMNIMDFVDSIKLQLSDLENVGKVGYVEGISNIIVKNLNALDFTQRPVHCTDKKREVIYVKDEDKWEKQDEDNTKLRKVIKKVTDKNMRLIPKYKEKYPDCNKSISRYSDQYNKIVVESMGGSGDNDIEKQDKIIKNISKQVIVEKDPEFENIQVYK
jgi:hypothetical protein